MYWVESALLRAEPNDPSAVRAAMLMVTGLDVFNPAAAVQTYVPAMPPTNRAPIRIFDTRFMEVLSQLAIKTSVRPFGELFRAIHRIVENIHVEAGPAVGGGGESHEGGRVERLDRGSQICGRCRAGQRLACAVARVTRHGVPHVVAAD